MKIYTKTGDKGTTGLFGGKRVGKSSDIITALGSVDEFSALLGIIINNLQKSEKSILLTKIQNILFTMGAKIADQDNISKIETIQEKDITELEKLIDKYSESIAPLTNFILPGGGKIGSKLHFARTICRRAERDVVKLLKNANLITEIKYLNRLSDLLFTLARHQNYLEKEKEEIWKK